MDITTVVKDLIIPAPEDVKDGTYTPTQLLAKSRADQEAAASAAEATGSSKFDS